MAIALPTLKAERTINVASIVSVCGSCGTKNRIPGRHLADTGRCGNCKAALAPAGEPVESDEALFDEVVQSAKVPVLVDFWASWCGPCRMAAPEVHALANELRGQALVLKVDTDAHPRLAARFGVQSIPNFIVFQDGQPALQRAGAAPRSEMRRWLTEAAGSRMAP
ncbi:MAG: thioredoxin TrxC [Bryobacterales bacterium]|nr:thioredoxin TrxC [Bryobacterales bacterium]MBV9400072.1 thioredoxin TrxC [Bryobacterales bacterium]